MKYINHKDAEKSGGIMLPALLASIGTGLLISLILMIAVLILNPDQAQARQLQSYGSVIQIKVLDGCPVMDRQSPPGAC